MLVALVGATGFAPVAIAAPPAPRASRGHARERLQFSGKVQYDARECLAGRGTEKGLAGARLLLRGADGHTSVTELNANGHFATDIEAAPPVEASVELESKRILVEPDGPFSSVYKIALGDLHPDRRNNFSLTREGPDGAANIFEILDQTAETAAKLSPVSLSQLRVTWGFEADLKHWKGNNGTEPKFESRFLHLRPRIAVRSPAQAFWDYDLMHEYGHYVLYEIAGTGAVIGGTKHTATQVFPDKPLVPWIEGFADGFASIVSSNPRPTRDCASLYGIDVSTEPAVPVPDDTSKAQYNEIAIAGTLWHLVGHLSASSPRQGLAPLLRAIHEGPPENMREFRDALIRDGSIETTADEHDAIDAVFGNQNIAWGFSVGGGTPDPSQFQQATYYQDGEWLEVGFKLVGPAPYFNCELQSDYPRPPNEPHTNFPIAARGALSYAWQSNCYDYNDGAVSPGEYDQGCVVFANDCSTVMGGLSMPFPYPTIRDETADYTLYVRWGCLAGPGDSSAGVGPGDCSNPTTAQLSIRLSNGFTRAGKMGQNQSPNKTVNVTISADQSAWTEFATINGMGRCSTVDCAWP